MYLERLFRMSTWNAQNVYLELQFRDSTRNVYIEGAFRVPVENVFLEFPFRPTWNVYSGRLECAF